MKPEFSVSLMCMDFLDIKHQIEILDQNMDGYHIDIMDGHYCKNITLSPDFMKACARMAKKPMDVHLMTTNPACRNHQHRLLPHAEPHSGCGLPGRCYAESGYASVLLQTLSESN